MIELAFIDTTSAINYHVNKEYTRIRSGAVNKIELIAECKLQWFAYETERKAQNSMRVAKAFHIRKLSLEDRAKWDDDTSIQRTWIDAYLHDKRLKYKVKYGPYWYPPFWLTFLVIGLPCPIRDRINYNLCGGITMSPEDLDGRVFKKKQKNSLILRIIIKDRM